MFWPFKKYDVEMSPEVHGVITLERVPQEGMTVVRELFYEGYNKGKAILDETQTIFGGSLKVYQHISVECQSEKKEISDERLPISVHSICDWNSPSINTYVYDQSTDTYVRYKKTPQPLECIFNAKHRVKLDTE